MYDKVPLALTHLDGQRRIYMCTDPDSSVNGMRSISTSQSTELSECYAPVICNHGPYGSLAMGPENRGAIDFSLCKARVYTQHCRNIFMITKPCKKVCSNPGMQM